MYDWQFISDLLSFSAIIESDCSIWNAVCFVLNIPAAENACSTSTDVGGTVSK